MAASCLWRIGCGLDYMERYRNLPLIGVLAARLTVGGG